MSFHKNEVCGLVHLCEDFNNLSFYSPIPLVSVRVDAKVVNFITQVEVTQEFVNRERNPIECVYFFPVEEEAAVVDFTAELEGRKIKPQIKEKEAAREEYNQAVQNRQTAFLLEKTKPDIFEIKVGYLSPGAGCKIKMTYLSELPVEEGKTKLTIPTTVTPRYIPMPDGSPEAIQIGSIPHDFSSPVQMKLSVEILMKTQIVSIQSPSHVLAAPSRKKIGDYFEARVHFVGPTTNMDRDMVVYIDAEEPNKPKILVEKNEEGSFLAMLSFVPEFKLKDHQIEAVFLVDCSLSMLGQSINLAKEALQIFLHSLPVNSFFNIIIFGSTFQSLFKQSRKYDDDSLKDAKDYVACISANLLETEIYQPLQSIFKKPLMAGHARQVFVLTDGKVSNSSACIDLVRKNSSNNRVFTLGIGSSADRHLVKGMARAGLGTSTFTTQGEPITAKVINQLKNALQPCISDVSVKWGKNNPIEGGSEVPVEIVENTKGLFVYGKLKMQSESKFSIKSQVPSKIPAIYDGSRLIAYKLLDESMDVNDKITVKSKTTEGDLEVCLKICKASFIHGNFLHQLFAKKLIQEVEERHLQENMEESKRLITEVGLRYKVASKYTSFVGVDEKQTGLFSKQEYGRHLMITRHVPCQMSPPCEARQCSSTRSYASGSNGGSTSTPHSLFGVDSSLGRGWGDFGQSSNFQLMSDALILSCLSMSVAPQVSAKTDLFNSGLLFTPQLGTLSQSGKDNLGTSSAVMRLTMCQAANGSFPPNLDICGTLGLTIEKVLEAGKDISTEDTSATTWMTLVVTMFLTEKCAEQKDIWELVVEKAWMWLQMHVDSIHLGVLEEKAKEFIVLCGACVKQNV